MCYANDYILIFQQQQQQKNNWSFISSPRLILCWLLIVIEKSRQQCVCVCLCVLSFPIISSFVSFGVFFLFAAFCRDCFVCLALQFALHIIEMFYKAENVWMFHYYLKRARVCLSVWALQMWVPSNANSNSSKWNLYQGYFSESSVKWYLCFQTRTNLRTNTL